MMLCWRECEWLMATAAVTTAACRRSVCCSLLDGWAFDAPVAAKDAAVASKGPKQDFAGFAFVEELARVGWHFKLRLVATFRTGQHRRGLDRDFHGFQFGLRQW